MIKNLTFFILLNIIFANNAMAQCAENLKQAQDEFDNGHLYGIPALLENCTKKGSKQDRIEAYRILTITYLYLDDPIAARDNFIKLLKEDYEYRVDSTKSIELQQLSNKFITNPIVSFRARGGVNFSYITPIAINGTYNTDINNEQYKSGVGATFIGSLDVHLSKVISLSLEPELQFSSYKYSNTFFDENGVQNSKDLLELNEKSFTGSLPISIKYTYPGNKFYPYVYGGYSPNFNIRTTTDAIYSNRENGTLSLSEDNLNITKIRTPFTQSLMIGGGVMRRIKYNYVFIDVRYKLGLTNRLVQGNQYDFGSNADLSKYTLNYKMTDNDFRQNEFTVTVGYVWPQYKVREKHSVTAKSFIGNLFKKKNKDE